MTLNMTLIRDNNKYVLKTDMFKKTPFHSKDLPENYWYEIKSNGDEKIVVCCGKDYEEYVDTFDSITEASDYIDKEERAVRRDYTHFKEMNIEQ